jgi:hypothetical protein
MERGEYTEFRKTFVHPNTYLSLSRGKGKNG